MSLQDLALAMAECVRSDIDALFRGEADVHESWLRDPRGSQKTMAGMPGLLTRYRIGL